MSQTYSVTGINLKSMALGETDRVLTMLTPEVGILRAVAPGARKQNSRLGGRTTLFMVNHCLIAKGRSLDKVLQAETHLTFKGLSQDLVRLTAGQYLAELALFQAIEGQPQAELFEALQQGLRSLESCPAHLVIAHLVHHTFQLLIVAGLAPEVQVCCLSRQPIVANFTQSTWSVEFSYAAGGTVSPTAVREAAALELNGSDSSHSTFKERGATYRTTKRIPRISAMALAFLQNLHHAVLPPSGQIQGYPVTWNDGSPESTQAWCNLERLLRDYIQYNFDRPIRSAELLGSCFTAPPPLVTGGTAPLT